MSDLPWCNLVMKGGITSGVVYPRAVSELAQHFRLKQLGGASAGAIAASLAAAAELRRASSPGGNDRRGFDRLEAMPVFLGEKLFALFLPERGTAPLFDLLVSFLGEAPFWEKLASALGVAIRALPACALLGLAPAAALVGLAIARGSTGWALALAIGAGVLAAVPAMALALVIGLALRAGRELPRNGFGLCRGVNGDPGLTGWLADEIDQVAGRDPRGPPLTFGDLWGPASAAESDDDSEAQDDPAASLALRRELRRIDLEMPTTSLGHARPYRMPTHTSTFFFKPDELRAYLPERVVSWMEAHPRTPAGSEQRTFDLLPPGLLPLPRGADLVLDFQEPERKPGRRDNDQIKADPQPGETLSPSRCWMSDGGIGSNFPIHFFDAPLPLWPTFGIDLWPLKPGRQLDPRPENNVVLPSGNIQGALDRFIPFAAETGFAAIGSFTGALLNALHAWLDNQQAKVPGFRDRIAHLQLAPEEGGLNLTMPARLIQALSDRGAAAGRKLAEKFDARDRSAFTPFDNHRWIRMRSLLPLLEKMALDVRAAVATPSQSGERPYAELLANSAEEGRSYRLSVSQKDAAIWLVQHLAEIDTELQQRSVSFEPHAPRPEPVLKVSPNV